MSETLHSEDIDTIPYPSFSNLDDLGVEELIKVHFQAWQSINISEVYGMRDVKLEMKSRSILTDIGVTFQPEFPQYRVPSQVDTSQM